MSKKSVKSTVKGQEMIKRTLFAICLMCLLVAGCAVNEEQCKFAGWVMGGPDLDNADNMISARVGVLNPDGIEFGGESNYVGVTGEQSFGAYILQQLGETPAGIPYAGYRVAIAEELRSSGPIGGTLIRITDTLDTVIEYQYDDTGASDAHQIYAGFRGQF